jgi:integrase
VETILDSQKIYRWNEEFSMYCAPNTKENFNLVFNSFKGIAWINGSHFFAGKVRKKNNAEINLDAYRKRLSAPGRRHVPNEYLQKLEFKRYSINTAKTYISCFETFMNSFSDHELISITELDIQHYLNQLAQKGVSTARLTQMINSIKFYYELVLQMPNRFYTIERPFKEERLPKVLSKNEIKRIIDATNNIKHRCIAGLIYSAGLRRQELIDLKIKDIDSHRMLISVDQGKGRKDRLTVLSEMVLLDLREYYKEWKPKTYLLEGTIGENYSGSSVGAIIKKAAL